MKIRFIYEMYYIKNIEVKKNLHILNKRTHKASIEPDIGRNIGIFEEGLNQSAFVLTRHGTIKGLGHRPVAEPEMEIAHSMGRNSIKNVFVFKLVDPILISSRRAKIRNHIDGRIAGAIRIAAIRTFASTALAFDWRRRRVVGWSGGWWGGLRGRLWRELDNIG